MNTQKIVSQLACVRVEESLQLSYTDDTSNSYNCSVKVPERE